MDNIFRRDRMTAYRTVSVLNDYGETKQEKIEVLSDIPCHLSFSGTGVSNPAPMPKIDFIGTLFFEPNINLLPGDIVRVEKLGRTYIGKAGEPAYYNEHVEAPLLVIKR